MMMKMTEDNVIVTTSLEKTGNASGLIVTRTFTEMGCNVVSIVFSFNESTRNGVRGMSDIIDFCIYYFRSSRKVKSLPRKYSKEFEVTMKKCMNELENKKKIEIDYGLLELK